MRNRALHEQGILLLLLGMMVTPVVAEIPATRQDELMNLLRQDCGSCHGMTLKGGLGPALTPDKVRNKSEQTLVETILAGRPGTPMPPWAKFMTREEARWLVDRLRQGIENE